MKKIILVLLVFFFISFVGNAQSRQLSNGSYRSISIHDWKNEDTFKFGPIPFLQGSGPLSDSLHALYDYQFYELEGEYFAIKNWADYYYWFTQKHPQLFSSPVLEYEYYWLIDDELGMVRFVFSCNNYRLDFLPTMFSIEPTHTDSYGCSRFNVNATNQIAWEKRNKKFH